MATDIRRTAEAIIAKAEQMQKAAPEGFGALSPLVASYSEFQFGRPYGDGLSRDWETFLSGAFGPLTPIRPVGIDSPQESGRPEPRRWQYPVGFNMPIGTPGSEPGLKLASFASLRYLADISSVVRSCVQVRQDEILGIDWDITMSDDAQLAAKDDTAAMEDFQNRKREALKFFKRPDPNYFDFQAWLGALLEDMFVIDAVSIYLHPSRVPGKGLLGSNLAALDLLDGSTIRPLLDVRGGSPQPPNPAYQQYSWGVPRSDLMGIISGTNINELDMNEKEVQSYRGDQLLYVPLRQRAHTPYGFSPVEMALIPSVTQLRRQEFRLEFFCYDDQTEVLTRKGWKSFTDVNGDEEFATRSPEGDFEWQHTKDGKRHEFDYDGDLVKFKSKTLDLLVTPNHRMLVHPVYDHREHRPSDLRIERADAFFGMTTSQRRYLGIPATSVWHCSELAEKIIPGPEQSTRNGARGWAIPIETWAEFLGLYLAEGSVRAARNTVQIACAPHSDRFDEVQRILEETPFKWSYNAKAWSFTTSSKTLVEQLEPLGHSHEKYVPTEIKDAKPEVLTRLLHGYFVGDGTQGERRQGRRWSTVSKQLADDIQELLQKIGRDGSITTFPVPTYEGTWSKRVHYEIQERMQSYRSIPEPKLERYTGKVSCVAVPNGIIYVRRNGKPAWCGNTEGSIPGMLVIAPEEVSTPEQIRQLQDALNAMAGDQAWKQKILVLGHGASADPIKPIDLASQADENMYLEICMPFEIDPSEIGLKIGASGKGVMLGGSKGEADGIEVAKQRRSMGPVLSRIKSIFDFILQEVCNQEDMEWTWTGVQASEDESAKIERIVLKVKSGLESIDEGRDELGQDPWGLDITSGPVYATAGGLEAITDEVKEETPITMPVTLGPDGLPLPVAPIPAEGSPDEETPLEQAASEPKEVQNQPERPAAKIIKEAKTGGAMIALYPSPDVADSLSVPGGEPKDRLHVTLKFLGDDHEALSDHLKGSINTALEQFAKDEKPLSGSTGAVTTFPDDGEEYPVVVKMSVPGIQDFRQRLVDTLPEGVIEDTYDEYKPHITLAYLPKDADNDIAVGKTSLQFSEVHAVYGGEKVSFPLGGGKTAKMLSEIDTLRRLLKKGRSYDSFTPVELPKSWLKLAHPDKTGGVEASITKLRKAVQADSHAKERDKHLAEIVAAGTAALVAAFAAHSSGEDGSITVATSFLGNASSELEDIYSNAAQAASANAAEKYGIDTLSSDEIGTLAKTVADAQEPYLQGLMKDVTNGISRSGAAAKETADELATAIQPRLSLYAKQATNVYEKAYGQTVTATYPNATATWLALGPDPCEPCAELDEQQFTADELPGYPGADVCLGLSNCNCELSWATGEEQ